MIANFTFPPKDIFLAEVCLISTGWFTHTTCSLLGSCSLGEHHLEGSSSVSEELWIDTLEGSVSLSLGPLDTSSVGFSGLIVSSMVLRLGHFIKFTRKFAI